MIDDISLYHGWEIVVDPTSSEERWCASVRSRHSDPTTADVESSFTGETRTEAIDAARRYIDSLRSS